MTRSSAVWATDVDANDLGDNKPTLSRSSISLLLDDARDEDAEEEDFIDAEAGWYRYVPVSIFTLPIYLRDSKKLTYFYDARKGSRDFLSRSLQYFPSQL
eukprot:scaffold266986_cov52-Attheya_sp.AAC.2